MKGVDLIHLA